MKCAGAFDIECADWDRFIIGATYDATGPKTWRDIDAMIAYIESRGGTWWAHAGGRYDALAVLDRILERGQTAHMVYNRQRITFLKFGRVAIRDSFTLWPVGLEEVARALGRPTPTLPWPCSCGQACGGYCRLAEFADSPELEAYVTDDARILYDGLHALRITGSERGISVQGTLGHTAWVAAKHTLNLPNSNLKRSLWRMLRLADFGGRTAIIRPHVIGKGEHHDICNAYPAQLAFQRFPVGECREFVGADARAALHRRGAGIYHAIVNVPESHLPPLPLRTGCFPFGVFRGHWTLPELETALARGVQVLDVVSAIVWERFEHAFASLMAGWYGLRVELGKEHPLGEWVSLMAKALSGKFAERAEHTKIAINPKEIITCEHRGRCRIACTGLCGAYEQIDLQGRIWAMRFQHMARSAHPHWSAYLRAYCRIQWLEQAERMGDDLVMGNTDSLWHMSKAPPSPFGTELGEWEHKHAWSEVDIRSINSYAWRDNEGKMNIVGAPGATVADWVKGKATIERGVTSFMTAAKTGGGLFRKQKRSWSAQSKEQTWYGDRKLEPSGKTRAVHVRELSSADA